jgi:hypothetical protein
MAERAMHMQEGMHEKLEEGMRKAKKRMAKEKKSDGPKKMWIAGAIKHPGALHKELHVPMGKKIPAGKLEKAAHAKGKLGKRARLAETLKNMHKD